MKKSSCLYKAKELTKKLTLREKIGQITEKLGGVQCYQKVGGELMLTEEFKKWVKEYGGFGAVQSLLSTALGDDGDFSKTLEAKDRVKLSNMIQKYVLENARIPIPAFMDEEAAHGIKAVDGVIYPTGLCSASSFNPGLYKKVMQAVGTELKLSGCHVAFATMLDVCKDPRWGRCEETYGEDPYLSSQFAKSAVLGLKTGGVLCCSKHFLGSGAAEGGYQEADISMGEREMRDIHLPPVKAATDAGTDYIMVAYNTIDGVPIATNQCLLQEVLRKELGYEGVIMSDGCGVISAGTKRAISEKQAAVSAIMSGINISLFDITGAFLHLEEAVKDGSVPESFIDEACTRVLAKKFEYGLFDNPFMEEDKVQEFVNSDEVKKLAYDMAAEGIVMLKNEGILPLGKDKKLAVVGQNATVKKCLHGSYSHAMKTEQGADLLTALKSRFHDIKYCEGWNYDEEKSDFEAAKELCGNSDVILFCAGGCGTTEKGDQCEFTDTGERFEAHTLDLPKRQAELFMELKQLGKPIVTALISGRAYSINEMAEYSDAIIWAWYPGQEGGYAIADVLSGAVNPSGKLTLSIPKHVGVIPVNYNRITPLEDDPVLALKYKDLKNPPTLYSFGHGLSYSEFEYSKLKVKNTGKNEFFVSVDVENVSDIAGKETVMLFIHGRGGTLWRRIKELKGFQKIDLAPHEKKTVSFILDSEALKVWSSQKRYEVEEGEVDILVGGNPCGLLREAVKTESEVL